MTSYIGEPCLICDGGEYEKVIMDINLYMTQCNKCGHQVTDGVPESRYTGSHPLNSHPDYLFVRSQVIGAFNYLLSEENPIHQMYVYLVIDFKARKSYLFDTIEEIDVDLPYMLVCWEKELCQNSVFDLTIKYLEGSGLGNVVKYTYEEVLNTAKHAIEYVRSLDFTEEQYRDGIYLVFDYFNNSFDIRSFARTNLNPMKGTYWIHFNAEKQNDDYSEEIAEVYKDYYLNKRR